MTVDDLTPEQMAEALEASGDYRVLRRLDPRSLLSTANNVPIQILRLGLFIDVETTGLDTMTDEIIELGAVPFTYLPDGKIFDILEPYHNYRDPGRPIPPKITEITGITDEMVKGQAIDQQGLGLLLEHKPAPIVAHNADFDRRFLERLCPAFVERPWACSATQVDWAAEGYAGTRLEYLAMGAGYFYRAHRAVDDCLAGVAMLALPLPRSGVPALARLLENGRAVTWRVWAKDSPFAVKDALKARGYRWYDDKRCWAIDVPADTEGLAPMQEIEWLRQVAYGGRPVELPVHRITAYDRFSIRV
jgi:DNA polymerase III subunit epsilon